jgi:CRISPR/Cas system endoribonuclease Cas6 (RAMP superfamily)
MVTFASSGMDLSHATGILEVAQALFQRTKDKALPQKIAVLKSYLGLGRVYSGGDYDEGFQNALADLTDAVHSHLLAQLYINETRSNERFQAVA